MEKEIVKNGVYSQIIKSNFALRNKIDNSFKSEALWANAEYLYIKVIKPLEEHFGVKMKWESWYRSPKVNEGVGGGTNSFHLFAAAVDLDMDNTTVKNEDIFNYIKNNLPFTELIDEYNFAWVHVALIKGRDREKVVKKIYSKNGRRVVEKIK